MYGLYVNTGNSPGSAASPDIKMLFYMLFVLSTINMCIDVTNVKIKFFIFFFLSNQVPVILPMLSPTMLPANTPTYRLPRSGTSEPTTPPTTLHTTSHVLRASTSPMTDASPPGSPRARRSAVSRTSSTKRHTSHAKAATLMAGPTCWKLIALTTLK